MEIHVIELLNVIFRIGSFYELIMSLDIRHRNYVIAKRILSKCVCTLVLTADPRRYMCKDRLIHVSNTMTTSE